MKRYIIIVLNIILAGYFIFAITSFNNPEQLVKKCVKVNIDIADGNTNGFLDANEIKNILRKKGLYPIGKPIEHVSPKQIEAVLKSSPFVNTAECSKTCDGHVHISVTQRAPIVRVKSMNGDDYYIDENGGIMPQSKYISDLIIVTGHVTRKFAQENLLPLVQTIMNDEFWSNQVVQINVRENMGIEMVPRVGDHIIFMGYVPEETDAQKRNAAITAFTTEKLDRLKKFYKYGLTVVGWNKYQTIDVQFSNQIICKKHPANPHPVFQSKPKTEEQSTAQSTEQSTAQSADQ